MSSEEIEESLRTYLAKYVSFTEQDIIYLQKQLCYKEYKAADIILRQGDLCQHQFFILKGATMSTQIDENGHQHVIQFSLPLSWTGELKAYTFQTTSSLNLICLEDTKVLALSLDRFNSLMSKAPVVEQLFGKAFQFAYIKQTERVKLMLMANMEKRLKTFIVQNPELIGRIEWRFIASYLGMQPETLSRLRKRLTSSRSFGQIALFQIFAKKEKTMLRKIESYLQKFKGHGTIFIRLAFGVHLIQYTYEDILFLKAGESYGPVLESLGVPFPYFMAWIVLGTEFFGGLFLIVGFMTRYVAFALIITFINAYLLVHLGQTYLESFEAIQMFMVSCFFLFNGADKWSIDDYLERRKTL